jgi:O-antigen/teichoic acid export membrane protein
MIKEIITKIDHMNLKPIYFIGLQTCMGLYNWLIILIVVDQYNLVILGKFLFVISFTFLAHMLGNFAADDYIVSKASLLKKNAKRILSHLVFISLFINLLVYIIFSLFFYLISPEYFDYYIILGLNNFFGFIILVESYYIGLNDPKKIFFLKILTIILFSILIILFKNKITLIELFILFTLCNLAVGFLYFILIFKKFKIKINFFRLFYIKYYPIFLSTFLSFFKMKGAIIILNFFLSPVNLGLYGLITKIVGSTTLLTVSFMKVFYNKIIVFFKKEKKESFLFKKSFIFTSIIFNILLVTYFAQTKNFNIFIPFTFDNAFFITLLIYMSLLLSIMKNYEIFLRILLINKNSNYIVFKATFYSAILQLANLVILSKFLGMKGAIIALLLNSHFIMFFYIFLKKKNEY